MKWYNYPKYESPASHTYPKNPFNNDRNDKGIHHSLLPGAFNVGIKFNGKPQDMLKLVCLTLIKIEIEWQFDPKEMKLKCRTKVDDEKLVDDDKFIEDFIRQQFLKFYVYIDKVVKNGPVQQNTSSQKKQRGPPGAVDSSGKTLSSCTDSKSGASGETYILNLYLQKGTYPVFLEMADRFFSIIQSQLAN